MSVRDQVLKSVRDLPPAPDVALRVMRIVRDPEYSADDLLRVNDLHTQRVLQPRAAVVGEPIKPIVVSPCVDLAEAL